MSRPSVGRRVAVWGNESTLAFYNASTLSFVRATVFGLINPESEMEALLLVGLLVAFLIWALKDQESLKAPSSGSTRSIDLGTHDQCAPTLRQTGKYFREVVGESFYQRALLQSAAARNGTPCFASAKLVLDDGNEHDSNAVAVYIDARKVGHLSRAEAPKYRARLARYGVGLGPHYVAAKIYGGGPGKIVAVSLDLPDRLAD